jgi:hypothetical protein
VRSDGADSRTTQSLSSLSQRLTVARTSLTISMRSESATPERSHFGVAFRLAQLEQFEPVLQVPRRAVRYRNSSFYEKLPSASVRVVDDRSADFGFPGKILTPVIADHIAISKPSAQTEPVAAYTLLLLKEFVALAAPLRVDVKRRPDADLLKYQSPVKHPPPIFR